MQAASRDAGTESPATWSTARRLLSGPLRHLVEGQVLGQAADGLAQIAVAQVVLFEIGRGVTPWELTKLLAVTLLPFSIVGPFAGVLIDRWDRRRTMVIVSVARAVLMLAMITVLIVESQALAYLAILVLLSASRFVLAAKGAALPRTVAEPDLVAANAISAIAGMTATFLGAVVGSTFVAVVPAAGLVGGAALYGWAAGRFRQLPPVGGGESPPPALAGIRRAVREFVDGLEVTFTVSAIRRPLLAVWGHRLLLGAGVVILVLIADERYDLEAPGYGMAILVTGVGAFIGSWLAPILARRADPARLLALPYLVAGAAALVGGFYPNLVVLMLAMGVAGLAFQVLKVLVDALVQRASPDRVRGRVFSVYDVLYNVAFIFAGLALVPLWGTGREQQLLWWTAVLFIGTGLLMGRRTLWPPLRTDAVAPHRWRGRLAALAAGVVPAFAFPEPDVWWLGYVGMVPLLSLIVVAPVRREALARAWLGGAGFFAAVHHWLAPTVGPFMALLGALLGLGCMLWGWVAWRLLVPEQPRFGTALVLVPSAWVAFEFIRSWEGLGGPWGLLGASQWSHGWSLSPAAFGAVWLVGFVLMAANVAVTAVVLRRVPVVRGASALVALLAFVGLLALLAPSPDTIRTQRVAGVQPGLIHEVGPRFDANEAITLELAGAGADLIVWGESSVGLDPETETDYMARLQQASAATASPLLVNVDARRGEGGIFKSSVLIDEDGIIDRYDKMRLVPFGEYIPVRPALGWVTSFTDAAAEDRRRGTELRILDTGELLVGPVVCFESAFPDLTRSLTQDGAELIVLQTATTTFQGSWAQAQHASLAAVRAVETGRPVLHSAVSGVSAIFDATGNRLAWMDHTETGSYVADVSVVAGTTIYVRLGDWVPALSFVALLTGLVQAGYRRAAFSDERNPAHEPVG